MKLKTFLLVVLNFLSASIICCSPTFGGMDDLFKDIDEPVLERLQSKRYPEVPYLPSLRFVHFRLLENMRFVRSAHNWDPDIPIHPQSVCLTSLSRSYPPDFRTSFVQLSFPSPDGVVFLANQAASDPVSKLTPRHIGHILFLVEGYLRNPREERDKLSFKKALYTRMTTAVLPASRRADYEELSRNYKEFLRFEFKNSLALEMLRMLPLLEEDFLREISLRRDDPLFYTKILQEITKRSRCSDKMSLREGEIEEYIYFQQWYKIYRSFVLSQRAGAASGCAEREDFNCSDPRMVTFLPFLEKKDSFSIFRFADTLTEALEEEDSPLERGRTIYPGYCVQRTLVTFFWKKAGKIEDIVEFYSGLFEEEQADVLMPLLTQLYSEAEYYEARSKALTDGIPFNSETTMLLSRGFEVFEDPLPPFFYYSTSYFKRNLIPTV